MVFQKRSSSEMESFGGRQVAEMPRLPKSARGKRSVRKKEAQSQGQVMCAFDLLATVAGNLLDGGEGSLGNVSSGALDLAACAEGVRVKQEQCDEEVKGAVSHARNEDLNAKTEAHDKEPSMISCTKAELGCNFGAIADRWSPESVESGAFTGGAVESMVPVSAAGFQKIVPDMYHLLDPMDVDKPPSLVSSDSTDEMPLHADKIRCSLSFPRGPNGATGYAVDRDDDDKSSGYTHPSTITDRGFSPNYRAEHSSVKKLLPCKYRKFAPGRMHRGDNSYSDVERKPFFGNKKMHYTRQRTQRSTFKRRKMFDRRSVTASEEFGRVNGRGNTKATARVSHAASFEANKGTDSMPFQNPCETNDCHVKLRIKSFKVPELIIEVAETATVGSLKKTVLEAVNAILGSGLRVGVLHHGKKVRDDSKTLMQAGIGHDDMLDNLGFSLEPNCTQNPSLVPAHEDTSFLEAIDSVPLARFTPAESSCKHSEVDACQELALMPFTAAYQGSDRDSVPFPMGTSSADKVSTNSKAIVLAPPSDPNAGAIVPANKSKRSPEQGQRRIRRPFSVAEVEALVLAVEKLGTGRWRDVKLRAFDNAKHRTYVDLKDKWKTLVHTASISPQQRRGEPVPQELLDRVLAAQAYWSQQQAKLQPKTPPLAEARMLT